MSLIYIYASIVDYIKTLNLFYLKSYKRIEHSTAPPISAPSVQISTPFYSATRTTCDSGGGGRARHAQSPLHWRPDLLSFFRWQFFSFSLYTATVHDASATHKAQHCSFVGTPFFESASPPNPHVSGTNVHALGGAGGAGGAGGGACPHLVSVATLFKTDARQVANSAAIAAYKLAWSAFRSTDSVRSAVKLKNIGDIAFLFPAYGGIAVHPWPSPIGPGMSADPINFISLSIHAYESPHQNPIGLDRIVGTSERAPKKGTKEIPSNGLFVCLFVFCLFFVESDVTSSNWKTCVYHLSGREGGHQGPQDNY